MVEKSIKKYPPTFDADCPLCRLAMYDQGFPDDLKTELLFQDERVIVVVDLDPKQHKERLLAVTRLGHIPCDDLNINEKIHLLRKLQREAEKRWKDGVITYDLHEHMLEGHEHFQANWDIE